MTGAELKTAVALELGITESAESVLLGHYLNLGLEEVVARLRPTVQVIEDSITANVGDYTLPTTIMDLISVWVKGAQRQLEEISPDELEQMRERGASSDGIRYYAIEGFNLIQLYNAPTSSSEKLVMHIVPRPVDAVNLTDVPVQYHRLIQLWVLYKMAAAKDHRPSQYGQTYLGLFEAALKEAKIRRNRRKGRRLGPAIVNRRGRPYVPRDNSTDVY